MTDNEIIKALECCEGDDGISYCNKCSLYEYDNCVHYISQKAREVINRQQAEIDRYKGVIKILERDVADAQAEIEKLQRKIMSCNSEAVKEFAKADLKGLSECLKRNGGKI